MESLRQYILSVSAAGIIVAVMQSMLGKNGKSAAISKMLTGIFLMLVLIQPITKISIADFTDWAEDFTMDASIATLEGSKISAAALSESIKQRTETYILTKARQMHADIQVEVTVSTDALPIPVGVRIIGNVSPYVRTKLQQTLAEDLGIAKENQVWI